VHGHGHGHGHSAADRVDPALATSGRGLRTLAWSFAVLSATAVAQLVLVLVTGSVALLGDTIHNFADALTALPLGVAFLLGRRAATRRYTYGLGRAEDLAGLVVVLLVLASAVFAGYEAVHRLLDPQPVRHLAVLAVAGVLGFAGNELVAQWRIKVGRRIGSAALVADGVHARTDGFTSLAVVVGAGGVALGFPAADAIIGLLITVAILWALRDAAREVLRRLMDAVDPASVDLAEHAAVQVPGVLGAGAVRMRWIGHSLRAELSVTVDAGVSVREAHRIAHEVEHRLVHTIPRLTAAVVHTEPAVGAQAAHELSAGR
jgi:cation diffusion facilitator family transporter